MKPEAQWYLVERLAEARAMQRALLPVQSRRDHLRHFAGVLAGFRYLEAVTQEEEHVWRQKMAVALGFTRPDLHCRV